MTSTFTIGSVSGEHVSILLPEKRIGRDGWFSAEVEVSVNVFAGSVSVHFETRDFVRFHDSLVVLYETLLGKAELKPIEKQLTLEAVGNGRGAIEINGCLFAKATYGSRLFFEYSIDQTYLPKPIHVLEIFLQDNSAEGV